MKKLLSLMLVIVLCLSLCACGGSKEAKTSEAPKTVPLTMDNFTQHLSVERNTEKEDLTWGTTVLQTTFEDTVTIVPLMPGLYEDVQLQVALKITYVVDESSDFEVEDYSDFKKAEVNGDYVFTYTMDAITLSTEGNGENIYTFVDKSGILRADYTYEITGVSGTYTQVQE